MTSTETTTAMPARGLTGICALALLAFVPALPAQDTQPGATPKPADLIEASLKAMGGRATFKKLETVQMRGGFGMPAMGIKGTFTQILDSKRRSLGVVSVPGMFEQKAGYDGKTMWDMNPMMGPRVITGEEKAVQIRQQSVVPFLDWREDYKDVKIAGSEKVDAQDTWKVLLAPKVGSTETYWISKDTKLPVRMSSSLKSAMGEVKVTFTYKKWKKVGPVNVPHLLDIVQAGQAVVITIDKVQLNEALPANTFNLPEDIQKLVKKAASRPASRPGR